MFLQIKLLILTQIILFLIILLKYLYLVPLTIKNWFQNKNLTLAIFYLLLEWLIIIWLIHFLRMLFNLFLSFFSFVSSHFFSYFKKFKNSVIFLLPNKCFFSEFSKDKSIEVIWVHSKSQQFQFFFNFKNLISTLL
jgi:hypothetical protein